MLPVSLTALLLFNDRLAVNGAGGTTGIGVGDAGGVGVTGLGVSGGT